MILSVRDPEEWWASYSKTIKVFRETEMPLDAPHMRQIQEFVDVFLAERFDTKARAISDYIAGMTDRYALDQHEKLGL